VTPSTLWIDPEILRKQVFAIEERMKILDLPPVETICPHTDYFSKGVYGREIFIPAGTILIGKIHKYEQMNVLLSGDLSVLTEDGVKRVRPPFVVVSPPGTKRIAYAHVDSRWLTVHGTELRDVDEIEKIFIAQTEQEYIAFCEQQKQLEEKGA
jgi:hypothetical protein